MDQSRIVVYLNQSTTDNTLEKENFDYGGEVSVLDDKTLRLLCCQNASEPQVLVAQKLRFDVLSVDKNEEHKNFELNTLVHSLFVEQRDCLLLHLTAQQTCQMLFLVDALIIQANVKLSQYSLQLERCAIRYKHLVEGMGANGLDTECSFSDTRHLMNWLLNEYRMRFSLVTGHEALELEYFVFNTKKNIHFSVKFHILLVAMEELNQGTLCGLRCYFTNDPIVAALSVTKLTSYMRKAAESNPTKPLYMLIMCNVLATGCQINCSNVQLLGLAHLAREQRDSGQERVDDKHKPMPNFKCCYDTRGCLKELETNFQDVNENYELVHKCLVQYVQQEQQLNETREMLIKQRAQFVPTLIASEAKLLKLLNMMTDRM